MSTFSKLSKSSIDCTLLQNYRGLRLTIVSLPKWPRKLQFHRVQQWFQLCWAIGGVVTIKVDNKLSVEPSISEQEFSIPNIQSLPTDSIQLIHWCTSGTLSKKKLRDYLVIFPKWQTISAFCSNVNFTTHQLQFGLSPVRCKLPCKSRFDLWQMKFPTI